MGIFPGSSVAIAVLVHAVLGQQRPATEPICTSRYDYEHKVLHSIVTAEIKLQEQQQRLDSLAHNLGADSTALGDEIRHIRETVGEQALTIKTLTDGIQDLYRNLTEQLREAVARQDLAIQAVNTSVQELQRNLEDSERMETNGYTHKDYAAQSTCMALGVGYVYAVRRACTSSYASCSTVCSELGKTCIDSLQVYDVRKIGSSDVGKLGLQMYRYKNCEGSYCGPNYCCCQG